MLLASQLLAIEAVQEFGRLGLMPSEEALRFWMIATAVMGGILSIAGEVVSRSRNPALGPGRAAFALHLGSYIFMSVSILLFAARGLLG